MVVVKIFGGLGNQMFQYAAGRALALRNNAECELDLSWFGNYGHNTERPFKLDTFNIDIKVVDIRSMKGIVPSRLMARFGFYDHKFYVRESHFHFDPNIIKLSGDVYLDGYWQTEKYFKDFGSEIRREFSLKAPFRENARRIEVQIAAADAVSLHVRRGDYANDPKTKAYHGLCTPEYYKEAIRRIKKQVLHPVFFVFSDDVEWVKNNMRIDGDAVYTSNPGIKDYEEMMLMSQCKHHIIANSSFSWWGAWLNENKEKIVIAPRRWFNDPTKDTSDLIPEGWVRI